MSKVQAALGGIKTAQQVFEEAKKILGDVMVTKRERQDIPVHCNLAASFGNLNKESVKIMDDELKIIIAGTTRYMARLRDRSWKNVQGAMMQNSLIQPMDGTAVFRTNKLIKEGKNYFKFSGAPDPSIVNEVKSWFTKLIADADVLKDTKIDIDFMAKVVAASGASVDSFVTFFFKKEYYEKTMVDVGILRYPDIENPYFKLYRIELKAWSDCSRILFVQHDKNGIMGVFNSQKFGPRKSVLDRLRAKTINKAVDEAEDLFS